MNSLEKFYGPNAGYVLDLYERYKQDPSAVDAETRAFFANWSPDTLQLPSVAEPEASFSRVQVKHIVSAAALASGIRKRGHLGAHLDPLGSAPLGDPALLLESYGLLRRLWLPYHQM